MAPKFLNFPSKFLIDTKRNATNSYQYFITILITKTHENVLIGQNFKNHKTGDISNCPAQKVYIKKHKYSLMQAEKQKLKEFIDMSQSLAAAFLGLFLYHILRYTV